ncbi:hypothetical protein Lalb_Chr01g0006301 [Lupinus albus]|uniref:Uncharacterized protein n=1 Tax=Lupinus albus TaxID=3870 RepID=A0A6A4R175_LUPAL|nr:hypothetical protein Lalb_Chr01g0006301 [Lupinus albus]
MHVRVIGDTRILLLLKLIMVNLHRGINLCLQDLFGQCNLYVL